VLDIEAIDRVVTITNEEAFETSRRLAREEGILAGISSGAAMAAALRTASSATGPATIVTVLASSGERYLSTELFNE
jgi:cysteine synthase